MHGASCTHTSRRCRHVGRLLCRQPRAPKASPSSTTRAPTWHQLFGVQNHDRAVAQRLALFGDELGKPRHHPCGLGFLIVPKGGCGGDAGGGRGECGGQVEPPAAQPAGTQGSPDVPTTTIAASCRLGLPLPPFTPPSACRQQAGRCAHAQQAGSTPGGGQGNREIGRTRQQRHYPAAPRLLPRLPLTRQYHHQDQHHAEVEVGGIRLVDACHQRGGHRSTGGRHQGTGGHHRGAAAQGTNERRHWADCRRRSFTVKHEAAGQLSSP